MTVELHRPLLVGQIPALGSRVTVTATPVECAALAERMGVPAVLSLVCRVHLVRESTTRVRASGRLKARVTQTCVVSLDDFNVDLQEDFSVRFVPAGSENDDIDPEADDEIPYENGMIDLGEAAAEQLGLALDPYPRMPDAALPEIEVEPDPHPFAALRGLGRTS